MNSFILYSNERYQQNRLHVHSPGRINLIGEHTDYNMGYVLPAAIDRAIHLSASISKEPSIRVRSLDFEQKIQFEIEIESIEQNGWARYFQAVVLELKKLGYQLRGADIFFSSDLPIGAGISSSAALTCGFIFALNELHGWRLSHLEMALIAQAAEHRTGVNCGIMDMYAVLHGQKNHVMLLDCSDMTCEQVPVKLKAHRLVLINTMVKHDLADTAYNQRRKVCESALQRIQQDFPAIQNLRDAGSVLPRFEKTLKKDYQKIKYVVEENRRVLDMVVALESSDWPRAGELLYQSHWGLSKQYEVSCPELDLLVEAAARTEGVLGARLMGGGFGGCTLNLLQKDQAEEAIRSISKAYTSETGIVPMVYEVKIADGIHCNSKVLEREVL